MIIIILTTILENEASIAGNFFPIGRTKKKGWGYVEVQVRTK